MFKRISILILICFSAVSGFTQTEKYSVPVRWERYKVSNQDASVLFPKLPVLIQRGSDSCSQMRTSQYAAYAESLVYGLNITFKTDEKTPKFCESRRGFDEARFEDRLNDLKSQLKSEKTTKITQNNLEVIKINGETFAYWMINDFANNRWFEIWTLAENETNLKIKNFVESVRIEKNPMGIEIENGAVRALGDEGVNLLEEKDIDGGENGIIQNLRIISKPRPQYTEAARQAQITGIVRLKVAFLANGRIGNIEVLNEGLPFEMTEQAINVASKMIFIPARKNGKSFSVTKIIEYSFSLY